MCKD